MRAQWASGCRKDEWETTVRMCGLKLASSIGDADAFKIEMTPAVLRDYPEEEYGT